MTALSHVLEHRAVQYRRTFRSSAFSSFLSPVLFLTAMGLGLGGYVDRSGGTALGGLTYLQFLAPGLLAATVMQAAAFEATFPIIGGLNWQRTFHAMYATPLSPRDIALGNLLWMAIRLGMIATVFTVVIVAFGAAHSPLVVLGIPIAVLTGMSFGAPIAAFSATLAENSKRIDSVMASRRSGISTSQRIASSGACAVPGDTVSVRQIAEPT